MNSRSARLAQTIGVMLWCIGLFGTVQPALLGQSPANTTRGPRVKFDAYHAHTFIDSMPCPGLNEYHLLQGPSRAAGCLIQLGWQAEVQLLPWSDESLRDVQLVVLNLVSADKPPFLIPEIDAIVRYVQAGGGLIVITDHTNCYYHCHVLGPLMQQLDIQLQYELACDRAPHTMSQGNGWIAISKFDNHPITRGVSHVVYQSGGLVDTRYGIAWTSEKSWADSANIPAYGEGVKPGFFGDFKQQPYERKGPLPVIAAKDFGAGRIAIIADQNAVGGIFLNYADNRRLWVQTAEWASTNATSLTEMQLDHMLQTAETDRSMVWCVEPLFQQRYAFGNDGTDGLFCLYAFLNKCADARATDKPVMEAPIAVIPFADMVRAESTSRAQLKSYVEQGNRRMIVIADSTRVQSKATYESDRSTKLASSSVVGEFAESLGFEIVDELTEFAGQMWKHANGSEITLFSDREYWENSTGAAPEAIPDETVQKKYESLQNWLVTRGLNRVAAYPTGSEWLDSLESSPASDQGR